MTIELIKFLQISCIVGIIFSVILLLGFGYGTLWCAVKKVTKEKNGIILLIFMYILGIVSLGVGGFILYYVYKNHTEIVQILSHLDKINYDS